MKAFRLVGGIVFLSTVSGTFATPQSIVKNNAATADFAGEPFVIESIKTSVRFEPDGRGQREVSTRIRVQSESAVHDVGVLVYPYMASFESFDILYVRVKKPDGTVVDTPNTEVQDVDSAVSRQAPMYTDSREKHIPVKSLAVGDLLETDVRWTIHDPLAPGHFWYDDDYFSGGICLNEELDLNVPESVPVKISSTNPAPEVKVEGGRRIYVFRSSQLDPVKKKDKDKEIPDWEKYFNGLDPPAIRLSSFASWADVGSWYRELEQPRVQVTPRIQSTAEEITKGKATDDDKIRAIYTYVSSRIRYIGIDLGRGRYTPHAAEEVLENRYGDCKDKHTLFAALLKAVGIQAYPVLISSRFKLDPAMPSGDLFDHVITAIPRGDSYIFLDTTPEVAPYGYLQKSLRGHQALVVLASAAATLVTIPPTPSVQNYEKFSMDASLDLKGTLDGKARFEERGDAEISLRAAYQGTASNKWPDLTQNIVAIMGFAGTVDQVAAEQPEKTDEPFWISYDYHRPEYGDWKNHRITLPFPPIFLPKLNAAQKESKDPLPLGAPQEVVYEASVKIPDGFAPLVPPNVDEKNDFAEYSATYSFDKGTLKGTRKFVVKLAAVPGDERSAYTSLFTAMEDDTERWIVLMGNAKEISPLTEGQNLVREGKIQEAITILEKAAKDDKDDKRIPFALGTAYLRLPDEGKAAAAFQKALTGNEKPDWLNDVAYEYADAGVRLPDAISYASRAIAETEADTLKASTATAKTEDFLRMTTLAGEWDTLGWAKFRSGDAKGAQTYLEASWKLWQIDVVGEHLVEVYEKLGKKAEAAHLCEAALSGSDPNKNAKVHKKLLDARKRLGIADKSTKSENQPNIFRYGTGGIALSEMREFKVPRKFALHQATGMAVVIVGIENGRNKADVHIFNGTGEMQVEIPLLANLNYHQPFPDATPARVLRAGWLSWSKYSNDCTIVFFQPDDKTGFDFLISGKE